VHLNKKTDTQTNVFRQQISAHDSLIQSAKVDIIDAKQKY